MLDLYFIKIPGENEKSSRDERCGKVVFCFPMEFVIHSFVFKVEEVSFRFCRQVNCLRTTEIPAISEISSHDYVSLTNSFSPRIKDVESFLSCSPWFQPLR